MEIVNFTEIALIIVGSLVIVYVLTRARAFDAQKDATQAWKDKAEAQEMELKDTRELNMQLLERIAKLEAQVKDLQSRPDFAAIATMISETNNSSDLRTAKIIKYIDAQTKAIRAIGRAVKATNGIN